MEFRKMVMITLYARQQKRHDVFPVPLCSVDVFHFTFTNAINTEYIAIFSSESQSHFSAVF